VARTVLDAAALIAALRGENARDEVEALLRGPSRPVISAVNLAEVNDVLVRVAGVDQAAARLRLNWLLAGGLRVEPVWVPLARLAGTIRAEHYQRDTAALSLADCACLATALTLHADLATPDRALAATARKLGLTVVALPNSAGQRP
jgi:PIN domain nuclease of toxin-antitoxin system